MLVTNKKNHSSLIKSHLCRLCRFRERERRLDERDLDRDLARKIEVKTDMIISRSQCNKMLFPDAVSETAFHLEFDEQPDPAHSKNVCRHIFFKTSKFLSSKPKNMVLMAKVRFFLFYLVN